MLHEAELRQDTLKHALQAAGAGVWTWEIASDTVIWSPESNAVFGVRPDRVRKRADWTALLHPDDLAAAEAAVEDAVAGRTEELHIEFRITRSDGAVRWILVHGRIERAADGIPLRLRGINIDITALKHAQVALHTTLESIGDGFLALDSDWRFVYVNAPAERILGVRSADVLGKSHWEVFPLTLGTRLEEEYRRAAAGELRDFEIFYEPWGRWFHNRCFPRPGGGMSVYFQDITERKKVQEDLRRSEARLNLALEGGQMGTWEWGIRSDRVIWNNRMFELYGLPPTSEQPTEVFFNSVHSEDIVAVRSSLQAVLDRGQDWRAEFRIVRHDGGVRWIVAVARLTRDADGSPLAMYGVNYDITERKEAESALAQSEARYRMLHESMRDPFVRTTMDGRLLEFNDLYCQMLGYSRDELRALSYNDLTPRRWHSVEDKIVREQIIPRGYSDVYEKEYRRKDGTLIPVELRTVLSRDAAGNPESMWAIVREVTERKANEARLRSLNEQLLHVGRVSELSQVSAAIAHELNQPLAAMLNYAGIAKRMIAATEPSSLEKARSAIDKAGEQALRASEIIRRMRGFVERRTTDQRIESINDIVQESLALALIGAKTENITTHIELAPDLPPLLADRVQIEQVLVNLLHNAVDAMADSPRREITVVTRATPDARVEVVVADTGSGIPEELVSRLFKPFVTTKPGGMGIGLAISHSIIEAHGGDMGVRPNDGGGTLFWFTLPGDSKAQ
jgi:two-component system sensor kinase FixL